MRDRALVLDLGAAAHDAALVERDLRRCAGLSPLSHRSLQRAAPTRARVRVAAPRLRPARTAAGPMRRERVGVAADDRACASGSRARPRAPRRSARCAPSAARGWGRRHSRRPPPACGGRGRSRRRGGCAAASASGSATASSRCSGASRLTSAAASPRSRDQDERAVVAQLAPRDRRARQRARAAARPPRRRRRRSRASSVIRIDCAAGSCSAWLSRSAAIQSGSLSPSATHQDLRRAGDRCRCRPGRRPGAWPRRHRRCRGRRSCRPAAMRLGAVGERGDRLRAADAVDLVDAGDARPRPAPAG